MLWGPTYKPNNNPTGEAVFNLQNVSPVELTWKSGGGGFVAGQALANVIEIALRAFAVLL